ncbi:site-specific integrase [Candidatus Nitrosotalea bavarica]|uniref:hypothetical protein n=1 Tax=Candidatus Nitrosotalea bavarica TaxID=1903277 RepID=UPI000C707BA6|nr:hypothetical protein [Candidatus Nitrosotalea bavarica]
MQNALKSKFQQKEEKSESQVLRRFRNGIEEEKTYLDYKKNLDKFCKHISMNYDQIVKLEIDILQNHLEDWVMSLTERGLKGVTTKKMLAGPMKFLDMNRRLYHKKALMGLVRENGNKSDEISGNVPYTGTDIKRMLEGTKKLRTKAIIHFFNSTGARPQSFTDPILRMKHLFIQYDKSGKDTGCYAVRIYDNSPEGFSENSKHGYWAFLTPEARNALDVYFKSRKLNGEVFDKENPLLVTYSKPGTGIVKNRHMEVAGIYDALELVIKSAGIERKKIDERFDKAIVYGFRKRFNTILKLGNSINPNIAEKLMHHKKGLDGRYLTPTREECFTEFKKAIIDLTIDDSERKSIRIEELEEKK